MLVRAGQTIREGHPLLAANARAFQPFTVDFEFDANAATEPAPKKRARRSTDKAQTPAQKETNDDA